MPIELTYADRAAMETAWISYQKIDPRKQLAPPPSEGGIREHFYRAGIAAGIERAAKHAEDHMACRIWTANEAGIAGMVRREIISAIRNLLKPS